VRSTWPILLALAFCGVGFLIGRGEADPARRRAKEEAMMRASARFTAQDWRGAEEHYTTAVEADPSDWATWHGRALARMGTGDFGGALQDFNRAIELNSSMANLYDHRGVAKAKLCRFGDAVSDFSMAIQMDPSSGGYRLHRAQALEHCGNLDGAASDYEKAIQMIQPFDFMHQVASERFHALKARRAQTY
jgi:Tfp pilus assembly protein PilF